MNDSTFCIGSHRFCRSPDVRECSCVRADDDCQKRTIKADQNLHEAIAKHGPQSSEAEHWRSELAAARSYCWEHNHRWWDEDTHSWHNEHDWDDHDHNH